MNAVANAAGPERMVVIASIPHSRAVTCGFPDEGTRVYAGSLRADILCVCVCVCVCVCLCVSVSCVCMRSVRRVRVMTQGGSG